jgi:hypothetical protein
MSVEQANSQILEQPLEHLLVPYAKYLTFGIDVAAGIIIAISAFIALIAFFRILFKPAKEQTIDKETIRLRLARGICFWH